MTFLNLLNIIKENNLFKVSQLKIYCEIEDYSFDEIVIIKKTLSENLEKNKLQYFQKVYSNSKNFDQNFYETFLASIEENNENLTQKTQIEVTVSSQNDKKIIDDI